MVSSLMRQPLRTQGLAAEAERLIVGRAGCDVAIRSAMGYEECVVVAAALSLPARFDPFAGSSKEAAARRFGVRGVNVEAFKPGDVKGAEPPWPPP